MRARVGLTPREQEVMELIAALGLSDKEIGVRLDISEHTVGNHLKAIYEQVGLRGPHYKRTRLVALIWERPEWRESLRRYW
jgi:DNA-binding CsgD family transcriptional regulator